MFSQSLIVYGFSRLASCVFRDHNEQPQLSGTKLLCELRYIFFLVAPGSLSMNKFNSDVDCWMLHKMATDLLNAA